MEYLVWSSVLETGYDFSGELASIGAPTDRKDPSFEAAARDAWWRMGQRVIAEHNPLHGLTWGEKKFGLPWETGHAH